MGMHGPHETELLLLEEHTVLSPPKSFGSDPAGNEKNPRGADEGESMMVGNQRAKSGVASIDFQNLSYTQKDIWLCAMSVFITFGDAVEIYLPGVITQSASTDLGLSEAEEGILGIVLYLTLAISYFLLPLVDKMVNCRTAVLTSLCTSIFSTVLCATVPNYWTLLGSRALLGMSIGINISNSGSFFAKGVSNYDVYNLGRFVSLMAFSLGGGWVAILGYLLLDDIGWRYYIICTSIPVFIPPILIVQFILNNPTEDDAKELNKDEIKDETVIIVSSDFWARLVKGCIANFINTLQGWGSILLVPSLLTSLKSVGNTLTKDQEFLILALLYGGAKLVGRVTGIFLLRFTPFRPLQTTLSVTIALAYLVLVVNSGSVFTMVIAMSVANMCYSVTRSELTLMELDKYFFGTEKLVLANGSMAGCGMAGAVAGATCAQFLSTRLAVLITLGLSWVQVLTFLSITER